jgi:hypothetical protein
MMNEFGASNPGFCGFKVMLYGALARRQSAGQA